MKSTGPPLRCICVGKLKTAHWAKAASHYLKRLAAYWSLEVVEVKDGNAKLSPEARTEEEGGNILSGLRETDVVLALDERGKSFTSPQFAALLQDMTLDRNRTPCFVAGGPFGLGIQVKQRAARTISLGPMTLPHELARVVLFEQLYRAGAILAGAPYHHE